MRLIIAVLGPPLLLANGFPAENYELTSRFAGALIDGELASAQEMLLPNAVVRDWHREPRSVEELATYLQSCPLKGIEGNRDRNINIRLDCSGETKSASLSFEGLKIREVIFGAPPQIITESIEKTDG